MVKFENPSKQKSYIELNECVLDKKIDDYESRLNRVPEIDDYYVDLGTQFRLAQVMEAKLNCI